MRASGPVLYRPDGFAAPRRGAVFGSRRATAAAGALAAALGLPGLRAMAQADLSISKTDAQTTDVPGTSISYSIIVANAGPDAANGATVVDVMPAELIDVSWACAAVGGASCTPSGAGDIDDLVDLPPMTFVIYTVDATIAPGATGTLSNTATVDPPAGVPDPVASNNTATDTTTLTPVANLSVVMTNHVTSVGPGTAVTYTLAVANNGPSGVVGATVADFLPPALTGVTWTAIGNAGTVFVPAGAGDIDEAVSAPVSGAIIYTIHATVDPGARGVLTNTGTAAVPAGVTDPNPANNAATDTDPLMPTADLAITKTVSNPTPIEGEEIAYTITVTNDGPADATDVAVDDLLPAGVTFVGVDGVDQGTYDEGTGVWDVGDLASGATVQLAVRAGVDAGAAGPSSITNSAAVSAAEPDPDALDNVAFATITVGGSFAFHAPYDAPAEGQPHAHVVGDLDTAMSGGGTIDVAVVIPDPDPEVAGAVQIFLNLGNGMDGTWLGLEPRLPVFQVGADPSGIAAGEFNGDGYLDLAVSNAGDGTVSILLNAADGSGTFLAGPVIPGFSAPSAVAAADFLGSGAVDLAVAESGIANVEYLENDGAATFTPVVGVIVGAAPMAIDDENVDLVSANFGDDSLTMMINAGGGSFTTLPDIAVGTGPVDLATGDLNFDGLADLASANNGGGTVSIVRNLGPAGDGAPSSFAGAIPLAAGAEPESVEMVDLDGDQDLDLVVVATDAQAGPALLLFENLFVGGGGLNFAEPVAVSIGADPESVLSGDFNGDGAPDLVTVNVHPGDPSGGSVTVLLNTVFPCPGDMDGSGDVGIADIIVILGLWGPCQGAATCEGDLDINGTVGFSDLLMLLGGWGQCP